VQQQSGRIGQVGFSSPAGDDEDNLASTGKAARDTDHVLPQFLRRQAGSIAGTGRGSGMARVRFRQHTQGILT